MPVALISQRDHVIDPVEQALADALAKASAAGQWEVVGQLARELEARRKDIAFIREPRVAAQNGRPRRSTPLEVPAAALPLLLPGIPQTWAKLRRLNDGAT